MPYADVNANMAKLIKEDGTIIVRNGNKLAQNLDPGNFHRRKARMDAINDMIEDDFKPKDGKKILDRLLNKKNKKKGKA